MSEVPGNVPEENEPESQRELPPADFGFLIYSLRIQAELNMGLLPLGTDEQGAPDFDLARHHIDLLAMLQQKTRGNLTIEEQRALDNSVTELRFRFVQAREKAAG